MKRSFLLLLGLALSSTLVRAEEKPVAEASASAQRESGKVPEDWRAALPEPVLGAHPGWVDFYHDTWRIADLKKRAYNRQTIFDTAFTAGKSGCGIPSPDSPVKLTVSSDAPFTLVVDASFAKKEFAVEKGQNQTFLVKR